jgi:drug/metabolite transporter (DMT)-like permease
MNSISIWLGPAIAALFLYGIAQGLVKKYIADVSPARFCLFFVVAKSIVNLSFFFTQEHPDPFDPGGREALLSGIFAYILDGTGWILYYKSIILGPITIVGTLSAAYPATTVIFARIFLGEVLSLEQYMGVGLVILSCVLLSISPGESAERSKQKTWIVYAGSALIIWGAAQTLVKYTYTLPMANEANLALFNTFGGLLTLGIYGLLYGRAAPGQRGAESPWREWLKAFLPMAMMAGGDLGVLIASRYGDISIVTPLTAAYPVVTLVFASFILEEKITRLQWLCILATLVGMFLSIPPS